MSLARGNPAAPIGGEAPGGDDAVHVGMELLQRVFAVDVLVCPNCGGRMRVIATIDDPRVVRRILTHLGLLGDPRPPPEPPTWQPA
jgi:hypothetical protein